MIADLVRGRVATGFSDWEAVGWGSMTGGSTVPTSAEPANKIDWSYSVVVVLWQHILPAAFEKRERKRLLAGVFIDAVFFI